MKDPDNESLDQPESEPLAERETSVEVIVTLGEETDLAAATGRLEEAGLTVDHVLEFLGQVTGRCAGDAIKALTGVEGVVDVAVSEKIQLPPPGSPIQ